jgi:putative redox protein
MEPGCKTILDKEERRNEMANFKKVQVEAKSEEKFKTESRIRGHLLYVDQPQAGGGEDAGPTPLEYLFLSLAGCVATIARIVANQRKIELRGLEVRVEGELDVETLRGKSEENRAGFTAIKIFTKIDADMTREEKEKFLQEIDRRCPVSDNIRNGTPVSYEVME